MPWEYKTNEPESMKYLNPTIRKKAISIANAILENGGSESVSIATGIKNAKKIYGKKHGLIKIAAEKSEGGIAGFTKRHPYLVAGTALTAGLAAADAGVNVRRFLKGSSEFKSAGHAVKEGLKEGTLYGGILGSVEPAVGHLVFKEKKPNE